MNNRLLLFCAGALVAGSTGSLGQTTTAAPAVSVTATASVVSQYMFRGLRVSDGGFQPTVEASSGDWVLGAWGNFPFDGDKVPDSSDPEIDLYGSYSFALEEGMTLTPGFTSYHYPNAPKSAGFYRSTFEPSIALSYTVDGVRLTPKFYYDFVLKGPTYEITAFYALPLKEIGSELDITATYGGYEWKEYVNDASPDVKATGQYWLVGVAVPFQVTPKSRVTVGFAYTEGRKAYLKSGNDAKTSNLGAVGRGVASVSYSYTF